MTPLHWTQPSPLSFGLKKKKLVSSKQGIVSSLYLRLQYFSTLQGIQESDFSVEIYVKSHIESHM